MWITPPKLVSEVLRRAGFFARSIRLFVVPQNRLGLTVVMLLFFPLGCTTYPTVELKPINARQTVEAHFSRAYYAPAESGEDRIVLLSDPIDDPTDTDAGDALTPSTAPPLWQVLYIELHWRSASPAKADALVASNAVLHWYVYGKPTSTKMGALHYVGTGSVAVSADSSGADVIINKADLKLLDRHGELHDPFREFEISTTFHARSDPAHLHQTLSDIEKAIAEADEKQK